MSFLNRIQDCNRWNRASYRPFRVQGQNLGAVRDDFAARLEAFPKVFAVTPSDVCLVPITGRTQAVGRVLETLRDEGVVRNWRNESYAIAESFGQTPLFLMERAATVLFGVKTFGVHLNGFVRNGDSLKMWIARRAADRPVSPGKLDQIVAGGQPAGLSVTENLAKECAEEASIPPELAARAIPAGAVSYRMERPEGLRNDTLFFYDLELPEDFVPRNTDGETATFHLMPIGDVASIVENSTQFKFNCSLVIIDFLIRHGVIPPSHPDYLDLLKGLQSTEIPEAATWPQGSKTAPEN